MRDHRIVLAGIIVTALAFLTAFSGAPHFGPEQPEVVMASAETPTAAPDADGYVADRRYAPAIDGEARSMSIAGEARLVSIPIQRPSLNTSFEARALSIAGEARSLSIADLSDQPMHCRFAPIGG